MVWEMDELHYESVNHDLQKFQRDFGLGTTSIGRPCEGDFKDYADMYDWLSNTVQRRRQLHLMALTNKMQEKVKALSYQEQQGGPYCAAFHLLKGCLNNGELHYLGEAELREQVYYPAISLEWEQLWDHAAKWYAKEHMRYRLWDHHAIKAAMSYLFVACDLDELPYDAELRTEPAMTQYDFIDYLSESLLDVPVVNGEELAYPVVGLGKPVFLGEYLPLHLACEQSRLALYEAYLSWLQPSAKNKE
ncbi:hypothetical protein ABC502_10865 [Alkalimonas sp. NCh-2]|uniref:hypothetical protein n=1 Tax=Alkalimonas sp. NCh-2 TaxID=3144846 RepID=UPI0031F6FF19